MLFYLDAHVHSKYSRATSKDLDLENLSLWANKKGIEIIGTGDFTHPAWFSEIQNKCVAAEPGLFRLKPEIEKSIAKQLKTYRPTRFLLTVEISTIYKKGDKTRKIHHLIYAKDLESAEKITTTLSRIGNVKSDGRPILGLDSRNLLEIVLEAGHDNLLIPAHIWTPWFAVLGSKSGFDSIDECYGDLAHHIYAAETGLSSDPYMNWRVSSLDRYRLVSNSDAHSPSKLGREATLFDTEMNYFAIKNALVTGEGYVGTVEFFPEEGKYHLDGHRKCNLCCEPEETIKYNGICPVCGENITVGVLHRVNALADRKENNLIPPKTAGKIYSLIPLAEIIAEINQKGVNTKTVQQEYENLITTTGSEFAILQSIPPEEIKNTLLREAISRLRQGRVIKKAGFDGEYGVIKLFEKNELQTKSYGDLLFDFPEKEVKKKEKDFSSIKKPIKTDKKVIQNTKVSIGILDQLDEEQQKAAKIVDGALLIVAGPGAGKTRTLTHRIAHMIKEKGVAPASILAVTFTKRAAKEMQDRLKQLLPNHYQALSIHTFHSLCFTILKNHYKKVQLNREFKIIDEITHLKIIKQTLNLTGKQAKEFSKKQFTKEEIAPYQQKMRENNFITFDDLITLTIQLFENNPDLLIEYQKRFSYLSIDEYQDIDDAQYQLIKLLAPSHGNLCVIGDPNQAIYKFRGGNAAYFQSFSDDYPNAAIVHLKRNYRSTPIIVNASNQILNEQAISMIEKVGDKITFHVAKTNKSEAEYIVKTIENLMGGHNFFSIDSGRANGLGDDLSFSDFAILYRTKSLAQSCIEAFNRSGMPFINYSTDNLLNTKESHLILESLQKDSSNFTLKQKLARISSEELPADKTKIKNSLEQISAFAKLVDYDSDRFFNEILFAKETDTIDERGDFISLMTLHAAKGLEFKVVFIIGLEDGILPFSFGKKESIDFDEEQRLFYVGLTRAKEKLYLLRAEKRFLRGELKIQKPSPFLNRINEQLAIQTKTKLKSKTKIVQEEQLTLWQ